MPRKTGRIQKEEHKMSYTIFKRSWHDHKGNPKQGRRVYVTTASTADEARRYCAEANKKPGPNGMKYEFEEDKQ
jgi:hypothetical protein